MRKYFIEILFITLLFTLLLSHSFDNNALVYGKKLVNKIPISSEFDDDNNNNQNKILGITTAKPTTDASTTTATTSGTTTSGTTTKGDSDSENSNSKDNGGSGNSDSNGIKPSNGSSHENHHHSSEDSHSSHEKGSSSDSSNTGGTSSGGSTSGTSNSGSSSNSTDSKGSSSSNDEPPTPTPTTPSPTPTSSPTNTPSPTPTPTSTPNESSSSTECFPCDIGYFANTSNPNCGGNKPEDDENGMSFFTTTNSCEKGSCLDADKYCSVCGPGYFSNVSGSIDCYHCTPGYYSSLPISNQCTQCPDGYVTPYNKTTSCYPCQSGYTSDEDHIDCVACDPGYYSGEGQQCQECGPGFYSLKQSSFCSRCASGTYNSYQAQSYCYECSPGFYNPNPGSVSISDCLKCPDGSYCPFSGLESPVICPSNKFCVSGAINPTSCQTFFTSDSGSSNCQPNKWLYIVSFGSAGVVLLGIIGIWKYVQIKKSKNNINQTEVSRLIPKPTDGPEYGGF